jgi:alkyl hydroperoxide reductase subunit AhpC
MAVVTSRLSALPKSSFSTTCTPSEFAWLNTTVLSTPSSHLEPRNGFIDSEYSHQAWAQQVRSAGGLGANLCILLLADCSMRVASEYGCLIKDEGITFRASYLTDPKGVLRYGWSSPHPYMGTADGATCLVDSSRGTLRRACPLRTHQHAIHHTVTKKSIWRTGTPTRDVMPHRRTVRRAGLESRSFTYHETQEVGAASGNMQIALGNDTARLHLYT